MNYPVINISKKYSKNRGLCTSNPPRFIILDQNFIISRVGAKTWIFKYRQWIVLKKFQRLGLRYRTLYDVDPRKGESINVAPRDKILATRLFVIYIPGDIRYCISWTLMIIEWWSSLLYWRCKFYFDLWIFNIWIFFLNLCPSLESSSLI